MERAKEINPASTFTGTFLLALFLVLAFGQVAHAETLWNTIDDASSNYYAQQTFGDQAGAVVWYNGSSTGYADTLTVKLKTTVADEIPVQLKIYDVTNEIDQTNPGNDAPVVAYSNFVNVSQEPSGPATWSEYTFSFQNTQFSLGRAYLFAFYISQADFDIGIDLAVVTASPSYDSTWYYNEYDNNDYTGINMSTTTFGGTENWALAGILTGDGITSDEYVVTFAPCETDSRGTSQCEEVNEFAELMTYDANINTTQNDRKVEILIENTNGQILDSVAYYYGDPGYYNVNTQFPMVFGSSTDAVYVIRTCLLPADEFAIFTPGDNCTTMIYGNGTTTEGYLEWWTQRNPDTENAGLSAFQSLGCDDLSVTEVSKAVRCALLWAFEPSTASLQKFGMVRDVVLTTYPLGYATHMVTAMASSFNSTSTEAMNIELNMHRWFGLETVATTTVSFVTMTQYTHMIDPVFDLVEILLWFLFAVWFITWGLSRKL